jgi:hypothetical protein
MKAFVRRELKKTQTLNGIQNPLDRSIKSGVGREGERLKAGQIERHSFVLEGTNHGG